MSELCIFSGLIFLVPNFGIHSRHADKDLFLSLSLSHCPVNTFSSFCCQDPPALSSAAAHSTRVEDSLCAERILSRSNVRAASE